MPKIEDIRSEEIAAIRAAADQVSKESINGEFSTQQVVDKLNCAYSLSTVRTVLSEYFSPKR